MMYLLLIVGFILLIKGADYFVIGSSAIARLLTVPSVIIGLTIVAMGTSAPEAAVSITAGLAGSNELALSNVIGSNFFNLVLIVGVCALIKPFLVDPSIMKRDFPLAIAGSFVLLLFIKDGEGKNLDVMELMNSIVNNIGSSKPEDADKVVNENLNAIDALMSNINRLRSEVGSKQNRMESAKEQNEEQNYNMTDILSKTEDIDFAEKTMEVSIMQTVYTASLQTSAKILQPTLMDFLR